ncbi:MAG: IS30 family transposase [Gammaproteobacteria bacterium]|jgi:IS30 family transposase
MKRASRIYYTEADKTLIWDRWQTGESLTSIARHFGRGHSSVQAIVGRSGGIRPVAPKRSPRALNLSEREEISRALVLGHSLRSVAAALGRAPSTVSREVTRNGGRHAYRASHAEQGAWARAPRPKRCKLSENRALARIVAHKLTKSWAPQQIAGWLKRTYPHDETYQVSHETIYRTLYIQARGALKRELLQHLRRTRTTRRPRHFTQKTSDHGRIVDAISISERPASVEDRAVPGHWEGDLIFGNTHSYIATLVERHSRYVMLAKLNARDSKTVTDALIKQAHKLPRELYKSLTWDRGKEMAEHKRFTLATDIKVYFCDPYHPWQRGSNENTNGLLRQYFPKGTDVSGYTQAQLNAVARKLNERPRKTLDYETLAERFSACVASTG